MGNKHLKDLVDARLINLEGTGRLWDFGGRTLGLKKNELDSGFLLLALTLEEAAPNSTNPKVLRSMIDPCFRSIDLL